MKKEREQEKERDRSGGRKEMDGEGGGRMFIEANEILRSGSSSVEKQGCHLRFIKVLRHR